MGTGIATAILAIGHASSTPMGPLPVGYRNPVLPSSIGTTTTTMGKATLLLKRKRSDSDADSSAPTKAPRTTNMSDYAETQHSATSGLRNAHIHVANPSERPFTFPQPSTTGPVYDSSNAVAVAPTHPLLQLPQNAYRLPTGLDPRPFRLSAFYSGLILSVPWFEIAMDRKANPAEDGNFVHTKNGIVCTKRRMVIVLWTMAEESVLVLPIASRTGRGLGSLSRDSKKHRICVKYWEDHSFRNESLHRPLSLVG